MLETYRRENSLAAMVIHCPPDFGYQSVIA
jgi:hypothetical protein